MRNLLVFAASDTPSKAKGKFTKLQSFIHSYKAAKEKAVLYRFVSEQMATYQCRAQLRKKHAPLTKPENKRLEKQDSLHPVHVEHTKKIPFPSTLSLSLSLS
jgi:hypothetical protein